MGDTDVKPEQQHTEPIKPVEVKKVSGHDIPNFSFTGGLRIQKHTEDPASVYTPASALTDSQLEIIKSKWPQVLSYLQNNGRSRISAALQAPRFDSGAICVTVANKAIEQELLDARMDIQDYIFTLVKFRVNIKVDVSADELFIPKPVSDSQRLAAMIEKHTELKQFCLDLKLRL